MGSIHTGACILGFIAAIGIMFSTAHNEWKRNSQVDSQLNLINVYACEGLWVRCTSNIQGQFQCDRYESAILALPAYLTALRAMMIISCIFSAAGFVIMAATLDCNSSLDAMQRTWARRASGVMLVLTASLQCQRAFMVIAGICSVAGLIAGAMGQDCIHVVEGKPKVWSGRAGGILMLAAGLLTLASVSWYAAEVVQEYWQDSYNEASFRYEFGAALYVGWVASGLALISGALMACCTCSEEDDAYIGGGGDYRYNPPKSQPGPRSHTEYV